MSFPRFPKRTFLAVAGAIAAYGIVGAFVAPPIIRNVAANKLGQRLGRVVRIDDVAINPYTLEARVEGFRILEPDGRTPFASFDALDVTGSAASIYHWAPVIDALTLTGLRIHAIRDGASHYNFSDVIARMKSAASAAQSGEHPSRPARFSLANIRVVDAAVDFDDRPNAVIQRVSGIRLAIPFISNLPTHVKEPVQPSFFANVNGTPLELTGKALPFLNTIRTHFDLDIRALDVPRYLAYLPSDLPVKVDSGKLDARISLRFTQAPDSAPTVDVAGTAALDGVSLSSAEGPLGRFTRLDADISSFDPVHGALKIASMRLANASAMHDAWRIPSVEARDIGVDLDKHDVRVASLSTHGGTLAVTRNPDGTIDLPRIPPSQHPTKWNVAVSKLALAGYAITVQDGAVKPAAAHRVVLTRLDANDLSTDQGFEGNAIAKVRLDGAGTLDASSKFTLDPLAVDATLDARSIDLVPLRAYVSEFPAVALKSGSLSAQGTVSLKGGGEGGAIRVSYAGSARVDHFATLDTIDKEELLDWKSVSSRGVKLDYAPGAPLELRVKDVTVDGAYSRIVVTPAGKLNVQQLMTATPENPEGTAPPPPRARNIRIDRITFAGSRLNFTDHYIKPNYTANVGELNGSVTNLSSQPASRAVVTLAGRWNSASPVLISGKVNPLRGDLFLDVAAKGQDIDLTKLSAYSERYAGYGITAGRLTLDVKYHVENGKLEGRNRILVDQLTFGDKVDSPEATKLPVLFAVNLLKDKNGRINLVLPISGSLEDPKFDLGAIIAQAFSGPLKKAETSPFSLIAEGAGGGDDLAYVEFEPGLATLTPAAEKKLGILVKALQDRPGLKIEIHSSPDAAKDMEALKAAALQRKLAAAPKDLSKEAREKLASEPIEIGEDRLNALSVKRMELVRARLVADGLAAERVLVAADPSKSTEESKAQLSRVVFALR